MGNTSNVKLPVLSNKIYKEWWEKTVLVQSCSREFDGELDMDTLELDIPVYHDLSVHQTSIKERELKPVKIEFIKSSTKRITIDKGRYSHWGETNIGKLVEKLSQEKSETRKKLVNKWAQEAEEELAVWVAGKLKSKQEIDLITLLGGDGIIDKDNVILALDILKAHAKAAKMTHKDFQLFTSEKFVTILRDTKLPFGSLDANETFRTGFVGMVNGVDLREMEVSAVTTRSSTTKMVDAEWGIWKTRDGIQYVVPYKNTIDYEISPKEILLGGKGYQTVEYYDFFNLYAKRLYRVKMRYTAAINPPSV
jgi:hypothetical protein